MSAWSSHVSALFFADAALKTIGNLGWKPDIIHAFGWISGFVPMLTRTTYQSDEVYQGARVFYTPNQVDFEAPVVKEFADVAEIPESTIGKGAVEIGREFADGVILPPSMADDNETAAFSADTETWLDQALTLYEIAVDGVTA